MEKKIKKVKKEDNTINCSLIEKKKLYSRDEVIKLIKKYSLEEPDGEEILGLDFKKYWDNWIEKNL